MGIELIPKPPVSTTHYHQGDCSFYHKKHNPEEAACHHNLCALVGPICSVDLSNKLYLAHGVLEQEEDWGAVMLVPQRNMDVAQKGVSLVQVIQINNCN